MRWLATGALVASGKSKRRGDMAHPERFELPTDRFVADYSIQLSYGCAVLIATAMGSLAERKGFEPSIQLLGRMLP